MNIRLTGVVSVAMAAALWSVSAQAEDLKATNGAACVPIVTSTGVPSTWNVVTLSGGRFSTQEIAGGTQARKLTFVCPLVRDDIDAMFPVTLVIRVNTFNALPPGDFTCKIKVVDPTGGVISQSVDVYMDEGWGSKVLNAGIVATHPDQAYVLTCVVPNVTFGGQRSGIMSYKWSEDSI